MSQEIDNDDFALLIEAEQIVKTLYPRLQSVSIPAEPGSDLAMDEEATPQIVHPAQTSKLLLTNVTNCLNAAITLYKLPAMSGIAPVEILLRTALIGASRAGLIVIPDDPSERQMNAQRIARADFHSANKAWEVLGDFEHTLDNADAARTPFQGFYEELNVGRPPSDSGLILRLYEITKHGFEDAVDAESVREQLLTIWHGYSGVAHGNTWPHSLSGLMNGTSDSATTGPLLQHLNILARLADYSLQLLELRSRASK